jgi:hypothetical protein
MAREVDAVAKIYIDFCMNRAGVVVLELIAG